MKRAEEAAIAYQLVTHGPNVLGGDVILSEDEYKLWNINYDFKAGYEQAIKAVLKIVNDNIERACRCMEESTGSEEYPYWDGAHDMANAIRREIELEDVL